MPVSPEELEQLKKKVTAAGENVSVREPEPFDVIKDEMLFKASFLIEELGKEQFEEVSMEDIRREQFALIDKSMAGGRAFSYVVKNKKFRTILARIEKLKKSRSKLWRILRFTHFAAKARRFSNDGNYFFAQEIFLQTREAYQEGKREQKEWHE